MKQSDPADGDLDAQQELWLGYDGLLVSLSSISALLVYQPAWDRRIVHDYGQVPSDVQAVVLLHDGRVLPARRALADLRARWNSWRSGQEAGPKAQPASLPEPAETPESSSDDD